MHFALRVLDIVIVVVGYIDDSGLPSDLPAFARTCKLFIDPALDALWRIQNDLAPLIMTMPSNLWSEEKTVTGRPYLCFQRAPRPTDWARFEFYAHRIRELGVSEYPPSVPDGQFQKLLVAPSVFQSLATRRPFPILPQLNDLEWSWPLPGWQHDRGDRDRNWDPAMEIDYCPYAPLFLGPRLVRLSIRGRVPGTSVADCLVSFLRRLPKHCPFLRELSFHHDRAPSSVNAALSEALRALNHITTLAIHITTRPISLDTAAWTHLASLRTVKSIRLANFVLYNPSLRSKPEAGFNFLIESPNAFPVLQELDLRVLSYDPYLSLVRACSSPVLSQINIVVGRPSSPISTRQLVSVLSDKTSLTLINITHMNRIPSDTLPPRDLSISLRPLFKLQNLISFSWNTPFPFDDLSDSTMSNLVASWPSLRCLHLIRPPPLPGQSESTSITLRGLLPLASHPFLSEICVPLIARASDIVSMPLPENSSSAVMELRLDQWIVVDDADGDLEVIARYLLSLFPRCRCGQNPLDAPRKPRELQVLMNSDEFRQSVFNVA
ncbi:hypothetical protein JAAARDRAFT_197023 [Jaapia argillacea MUCL 33604]|uniref:F-box domain-containing protein n=1 Tax=Jaapia argillacea MUCL 33604 TaxID=933084 RepID=A0A067PUB8_9AGAM|nr:hypothetical protein JAAARDRAFT_197023 [Jaapia argillacea MUCL 33604]